MSLNPIYLKVQACVSVLSWMGRNLSMYLITVLNQGPGEHNYVFKHASVISILLISFLEKKNVKFHAKKVIFLQNDKT